MKSRVLTERELTVSFLDRQMLLKRRRLQSAQAVPELAALQAQYAPAPHLSLFARLVPFARTDLEKALAEGTVVKATLMRGTLHVVGADDYPAFASAWHRQWRTTLLGRLRRAAVDAAALTADVRRFTSVPRSTDAIRDRVARWVSAGSTTNELLDYARGLVPMLHVPPSGFWHRQGKAALVVWTGQEVAEPAATALLVRRYLAAFGPSTREDIAHFTGLPYRQLDPAVESLLLQRFEDPQGRELLDLARANIPREDTATPVRFLPPFDAALISRADRERTLPAALRAQIVKTANGTMKASVLIDGQIAGAWASRLDKDEAVLSIQTDAALPTDFDEEAERLLQFLEPDAKTRRIESSSV